MRADLDALRDRRFDGLADGRRVSGMESASDIDRRNLIHQRGIVTHCPSAEAFPHVAI